MRRPPSPKVFDPIQTQIIDVDEQFRFYDIEPEQIDLVPPATNAFSGLATTPAIAVEGSVART